MSRTPRVFLGFLDICGLYWALESGFRELGVPVYFLDLGEDTLGYRKSAVSRPIPEFFRRAYVRYLSGRDAGWHSPMRYVRKGAVVCAAAILVVWMLLRFDIFVIKSGQSLASDTILFRLLRFFGKTIIFTFHGSDSRPPYLNPMIKIPDADLVALTAERKRFLDKVTPFANFIIDNPLSAQLQTKRCCVYHCFFNSKSVQKETSATTPETTDENRLVKVLHAPSYPELKGTAIIRDVIGKLQREGYEIAYKEIIGLPNEIVLEEISKCDLVVDELYSDTYGAVFAQEAAVQGKPVIVCGYGRDELDRFVPSEAALPTHYCLPEEFESALRKLLDDAEYRLELGRRARAFATGWSSPKAAAERFLQLAKGEAPDDWFFDPHEIRYVHGVGGPEMKVRRQVGRLLDCAGPGALLVDDKPGLRDVLIAFAKHAPRAAKGTEDSAATNQN